MQSGANIQASAPKRIRTCIACGAKSSKTSLQRIVRTPDGDVEYDPRGRAAGRGAYVCSVECLERALKTGRIERSLKTKVSDEQKESVSRAMRKALCDTSEEMRSPNA